MDTMNESRCETSQSINDLCCETGQPCSKATSSRAIHPCNGAPQTAISSQVTAHPLTSSALIVAGRHLVRWRALTFYSAFLPKDSLKDHRAAICAEARCIREALHPVSVSDAWRVYFAARSQTPSPDMSSIELGTSKENILHKLQRKCRRQASPIRVPLESNQAPVPRENTLSSDGNSTSQSCSTVEYQPSNIFAIASGELHVSQASLEMAFKCYVHWVEQPRSSREAIEALDLIKDKKHNLLAEILIIDMDDFAPCLGDVPGESRLRRVKSRMSLDSSSSAWDPPSWMGRSGQSNLLGNLYPSILTAIAGCRDRYFVRLDHQNPKPLCHCGPDSARCSLNLWRVDKKGKCKAVDWSRWRIRWELTDAEAWRFGKSNGYIEAAKRKDGTELCGAMGFVGVFAAANIRVSD